MPRVSAAMMLTPLIALAIGHAPFAHGQPAPELRNDAPAHVAPASLPTLQRTVRHFDFDDTDVAPDALPNHFYRYIAPSEGFPPFGSMRISQSDDREAGSGAFLFELAGGSMSARLSTSVIPVLPLSDYAVSARVKTQGLRHARARLVAWLHDAAGNPILQSVVHSRAVNTADQWQALNIEIRGDDPKAADLVIELQLVQPSQYENIIRNANAPQLEDISGRAWFDDVTIAHLPRVTLSLAQPSRDPIGGGPHRRFIADGDPSSPMGSPNVVRQSQLPELRMMVSELSSERLMARLRVLNIDGREVFDSTFPAPRGRQPGVVRLPVNQCGWYRAVLDVISQNNLARRRWLDFVVIPDPEDFGFSILDFGLNQAASDVDPKSKMQNPKSSSTRLAVVLADSPPEQMPTTASLVDLLNVDAAMVPVWHRSTGTSGDQVRHAARKQLIEELLRRGVDLIFWLNVVPDDLGRLLNLESNQVIDVLAHEPRLWRPYLDDLLVNFGLQVNRWHLGAPGSASSLGVPISVELPMGSPRIGDLKAVVDGAARSFADFVPDSTMYTSWLAEHEPDSSSAMSANAIIIPNQVQPEGVELYAEPWLAQGSDVFATLQLLPADRYSPRRRVSDMMLRTLYAWRAKLPEIAIDQPWQHAMDREYTVMPDPCFGAWRTLAQELGGRRFAGELNLGEGVKCWILAGRNAQDHAVVAWADIAFHGSMTAMRTQLASTPVRTIDAFGNTAIVNPLDGLHTIALSDLPVFIEGVDLELVQFRSALVIVPEFVPAVAKVHEHQIVLRNPWNVAISGTIRLRTADDWQLLPAVQDFIIRPGGEIRLPLNIVPQRSILAGRKQIEAEITLSADRAYRMKTHAHLEVGLPEIDLAASWTVLRNIDTGVDDLIITQAVTNRSKRPVNLSVFIQANNVGQNRRSISGLEPGDTAVRSFRIPNGAALLVGQQLRVGVSETDGPARLNRVLSITPRGEPVVVTAHP